MVFFVSVYNFCFPQFLTGIHIHSVDWFNWKLPKYVGLYTDMLLISVIRFTDLLMQSLITEWVI